MFFRRIFASNFSVSATAPVVCIQTCVPDYRVLFFRELARVVGEVFIAAGGEYFSPGVTTVAREIFPVHMLENRFLWRRSLLWQHGAFRIGVRARILVVEWNPRVLSTWVVLLLRTLMGRKTLVWGHARSQERFAPGAQAIRNFMARVADGVVAYTENEAVACRGRNPGLPVWAAPNSSLSESQCLCSSDSGVGSLNVVYVGRLTPGKKPSVLIRAWALCLDAVPAGSCLILVGDGPERRRLENLIRELGLSERVVLLGHVSDADRLRAVYDRAIVAVSPGYVGLSAIQCMAHGVAMAISRSESHSPEIEACHEDVNCRFFSTDNAEDLARVLKSFYSEVGVWIERRKSISAHIRSSYTVELMARGFANAVDGLSSKPGGGAARAALVWAQYGPYHQARLAALRNCESGFVVLGLELASKTQTYLWQRTALQSAVHSLETVRPVEKISALRTYRRAVRFFKSANVRVVFVPSYWPATSLAVLFAAYRTGARTVMMNESHEHTARAKGLSQWVKRKLVGSFDAGLVGGRPQRQFFEKLGMAPERVFEGYDAVDNEYFASRAEAVRADAMAVRKRYGLPARYFLNIGRMEPKKNLGALIRSYKDARLAGPEFPRLVLVGSGQTEAALRKQCAASGLSYADMTSLGKTEALANISADVLFYGFRQLDELPNFYALAEAFVLPSLWEEWGLVVNEAMASSIPVLVSEVAGCAPDLVVEGATGYTFDPMDVGDLTRCMVAIAGDEPAARRMGANAREHVQRWGLEKFAKNASLAARMALGNRDTE